jgi:hypothetical protein
VYVCETDTTYISKTYDVREMKGDVTLQENNYNASLTADMLYTFEAKLRPTVLLLKPRLFPRRAVFLEEINVQHRFSYKNPVSNGQLGQTRFFLSELCLAWSRVDRFKLPVQSLARINQGFSNSVKLSLLLR